MRLINTETLELHEVLSIKTTPYAILSHRWDDDEVTFQDLRGGKAAERKGWKKILGCCAKAFDDGWDYMTSSAELSESLNSMFAWYQNAHVCYAYLSDVYGDFRDPYTSEQLSIYDALQRSQWFRRGWTLQELLAPHWVVFLAEDWSEIGTKASLANDITSITGITNLFNFEEASVAQKMSWAAHRRTTRLEDQAYCMMGLFDVNMPLLYGEGSKAFIRLQLEILSKSDDETIFVWSNPAPGLTHSPGLLTDSPQGFEGSGRIKRGDFDPTRPPHFMTNKGLQMQLLLQQTTQLSESATASMSSVTGNTYVAPLNCIFEDENDITHFVTLYFMEENGVYSRCGDPDLATHKWISERKAKGDLTRTLCHIKQPGHNDSIAKSPLPERVSYTIIFDTVTLYDAEYYISEGIIWPENATSWNFVGSSLSGTKILAATITSSKNFILVRCKSTSEPGPPFTILLGYFLRRPWIGASTTDKGPLRDIAAALDKQNRWPQSQNDPRTLQDRGWVQIGSSRYIDFTLRKTGLGHSSSSERYWVETKIRDEPEEAHKIDVDSGQLVSQQQEENDGESKGSEGISGKEDSALRREPLISQQRENT